MENQDPKEKADLDNHANQLNPNNEEYAGHDNEDDEDDDDDDSFEEIDYNEDADDGYMSDFD